MTTQEPAASIRIGDRRPRPRARRPQGCRRGAPRAARRASPSPARRAAARPGGAGGRRRRPRAGRPCPEARAARSSRRLRSTAAPAGKATPPRALNYTPPEYPPEAEKQRARSVGDLAARHRPRRACEARRRRRERGARLRRVGPGRGPEARVRARPAAPTGPPPRRASCTATRSPCKTASPPPAAPASPRSPPRASAAPCSPAGATSRSPAPPSRSRASPARLRARRRPPRRRRSRPTRAASSPSPTCRRGATRSPSRRPASRPLSVEEALAAGEQLEVKYRLLPQGDGLEVTVRGERPPREVTKRTIEQREINRIPGTNGDALRSLQNLPGVARPPAHRRACSSSAAPARRTRRPSSTARRCRSSTTSAASPRSCRPRCWIEIDFYPGNFSAQYGRVQGGIVDVALRSPNEDGKLHGLAPDATSSTRALLLEGPVPFLENTTLHGGRAPQLHRRLVRPRARGRRRGRHAGAGLLRLPGPRGDRAHARRAAPPRVLRLGRRPRAAARTTRRPTSRPLRQRRAAHGVSAAPGPLRSRAPPTRTGSTACSRSRRDDADFGIGPIYSRLDLKTISRSPRVRAAHLEGHGVQRGARRLRRPLHGEPPRPGPTSPRRAAEPAVLDAHLQEVSRGGEVLLPRGVRRARARPDPSGEDRPRPAASTTRT